MAQRAERAGESVNTGSAAVYLEEFVLCRFFSSPLFFPSPLILSLHCDGAVSLSSLVRVANEIGLAGLHRAKALCLVSLGETAVAPPSEREAKMQRGERGRRSRRRRKSVRRKKVGGAKEVGKEKKGRRRRRRRKGFEDEEGE